MATATSTPTKPARRRPAKAKDTTPSMDAPAPDSENTAPNGRSMSDSHLNALASGRTQSAAISRYLDALEIENQNRPRRGRRVSLEQLQAKLAAVEDALKDPATKSVVRIQLIQERFDLEERIASRQSVEAIDMAPLEQDFIAHAAPYSERKKIGWKAWRAFGVPTEVLRQAGISQSS